MACICAASLLAGCASATEDTASKTSSKAAASTATSAASSAASSATASKATSAATSSTASKAASSSTASAASGTSAAASGYKVAMISDTSVSDGGWGASCYQAMLDAAKEEGWETTYTDNISVSDYVTALTDYADQGYQLIFAPGNQYQDAVNQVSDDYPDIDFCLLNGTLEKDNVTSVLPDANQIGYMAGALAGLMSKTNQIGFIGGMELDTTKAKLECYTKAAQKVNPSIQVQSAYAGSFSDAAKGKEIAASMISTYNVDVMFGDASAVDTGAREAMAASADHYDIGQPGDLGSADDKLIICSVVTDNAALVKQCMEDVANKSFGNKTIEGDLSNGCLSVGTFSSLVSSDIQKQYTDIVEQIKAGTWIQ